MTFNFRFTLITIVLSILATAAFGNEQQDQYCKYLVQTAKAQSGLLRTPAATVGLTQPNTGTQLQAYYGVAGSLSDLRKAKLTEEIAKQGCSLYQAQSDAQQAIEFAIPALQRERLAHRLQSIDVAIQWLGYEISKTNLALTAQNATKPAIYALEAARLRLISDREKVQNDLAAVYVPEDLPTTPIQQLVALKEQAEQKNQNASTKLAKQSNWDVRWEVGGHQALGTPSIYSGVSGSGAYGGIQLTYNLGSKRINQHLDQAGAAYTEWKKQLDNDVTQGADDLNKQIHQMLAADEAKLVELRLQQKNLNGSLKEVQVSDTSAGLVFKNQLVADQISLSVEVDDTDFQRSQLETFLDHNFGSGKTGSVALTFDDGYESAYKAVAILDKAKLPATFYIITQNLNQPTYMTADQVKDLQARGFEIGSHTRHHKHLPTLSLAEQRQEIGGSLADFAAMGIQPKSFAYPFGEWNEDSLTALREAGFAEARTTNPKPNSNPLLTPGYGITNRTTIGELETAIDNALRNGDHLVLVFHRVDEPGNEISVSSELLQQVADYLVNRRAPVLMAGRLSTEPRTH